VSPSASQGDRAADGTLSVEAQTAPRAKAANSTGSRRRTSLEYTVSDMKGTLRHLLLAARWCSPASGAVARLVSRPARSVKASAAESASRQSVTPAEHASRTTRWTRRCPVLRLLPIPPALLAGGCRRLPFLFRSSRGSNSIRVLRPSSPNRQPSAPSRACGAVVFRGNDWLAIRIKWRGNMFSRTLWHSRWRRRWACPRSGGSAES